MKLREIQQALEALGIYDLLKRTTEVGSGTVSSITSAVTSFLGLTDTPSSYSGQANKFVKVKSDETGLEFGAGGGGVDNHGDLTGLTDDDHEQYLLVDGSRAMAGALDMDENETINFVFEKVDDLPIGGEVGRAVFLTDDDHLYLNDST